MIWVPIAISIVQLLGLLAGVIIAYRGLNTWRRQRVDGRKIDIAEEALRGFARMEAILFGISHGAVSGGERHRIISEFLQDLENNERERVSAYAAPLFREQQYQAEIKAFFDQRYICRAYFGKAVEQYFDDLRTVLIDIRIAAQMLVSQDRYEPQDQDTRDLYQELRMKIWMGSVETHPLHIKTLDIVERATEFFSKELRPH